MQPQFPISDSRPQTEQPRKLTLAQRLRRSLPDARILCSAPPFHPLVAFTMADDNSQPGAPTPKDAAKASDRVTSKSVSVPSNALSAVKQLDRIILRLNKYVPAAQQSLGILTRQLTSSRRLLATPGGLSAFLSTFNYALYILAYLQPKLPSLAALRLKLIALIAPSKFAKPPTTTLVSDPAVVPPVAALAGLVSRCRTTLRLLGCFPLYAWLRTLLAGPKPGTDAVLHRIAVLQASSYFTYQALENISVLADSGIVPSSFIARINRGDSTTARVYLWAYRAWLGGVSCDFLRLAREAQLESRRRAARTKLQEDGRELATYQEEEDKKVDAKWWMDLMIASAWLPMALHFSSANGGLPGWNVGWMGLCGLVAGGERFRGLWNATLL